MSVQWGQSTDPKVTGYRLRVTQNSTGATSVIEVGNTTSAAVDNLLDGQTYNVAVVAYNVDGIESDPSNFVSYTVPVTGPTYALQFGKFSHATVQYSPHGTMTSSGEAYPAGTMVSVNAMAGNGFMCTGWTINSVFYPGNPKMIAINADTLVAPVIAKTNGTIAPADPSLAALQISTTPTATTIAIGGEFGAWILEGTSNFLSWTQLATGLTSDQVTVPTQAGNQFYRVRSAQLTALATR